MAVIYAFNVYRAIRLLEQFSQQADGVVRDCHELDDKLNDIRDRVSSLKDGPRALGVELEHLRRTLEHSLKFCRVCAQACELTSTELMIRKRDRLRRHLTKH